MEKVKLEVTVIMTEKGQIKKELNRVNRQYAKLQQDNKEQISVKNALIDEVSILNKKCGEYRGLIVDQDHKVNMMQKEIRDLKKTVKLKDKLVNRLEEEKQVLKK